MLQPLETKPHGLFRKFWKSESTRKKSLFCEFTSVCDDNMKQIKGSGTFSVHIYGFQSLDTESIQ